MVDPLSVSASIAGLITIADIVVRNGYKYIKAVKKKDTTVKSLIASVNLLSGTLHSLRNVAERLEGDSSSVEFTTQTHHVEACYQTLKRLMNLLDKFAGSKDQGILQSAAQKLRWPLTVSETEELEAEIEKHQRTLSLALQADEM
jgi:Fungal N-terminal domain of STAND proteins